MVGVAELIAHQLWAERNSGLREISASAILMLNTRRARKRRHLAEAKP